MFFRLAADAVLILHLAFIVFAVFGALLAFRWRWIPVIHLPVAAWGIVVEMTGWICPLTYLENHFRRQAGQAGYNEGCIEHYLLDVIYPAGLTHEVQHMLAALVLVINLTIYTVLVRSRRRNMRKGS